MESDLIHWIYSSAAAQPLDSDELESLIKGARQKNARLGVTGMLLYADGSFFQVLEGKAAVVDHLLNEIARDPRHERVTKVIHEPIARRHFGDWTMGLSVLSRSDLSALEGSNDFFGTGHCFNRIDAGRAKKLLAAFRAGRWRKSIEGAVPQRSARRVRT